MQPRTHIIANEYFDEAEVVTRGPIHAPANDTRPSPDVDRLVLEDVLGRATAAAEADIAEAVRIAREALARGRAA